ncbi:MAG: O-antigen ligase family protein [Xanthomonadales bacterium]|nr:O-antigen ligase family protein [Xanthomonadales bacterium]ODU92666.1 MAG: polymerase [Rhodanobacter sp. SCN 66-43]OJY85391.1 MAG: polymerase [Xanthomonadales bacterium 66-474]
MSDLPGQRIRAALLSPLTPIWLVVFLLPFGRSSELGTLICMLGAIILFARDRRALTGHPGARLVLWLWAAYFMAALISAPAAVDPARSWSSVAAYIRFAPFAVYVCFAVRRESRLNALCLATAIVVALWALDAWVQALTGYSLGGRADAQRISGIFGAGNLKLGPVLASLSPFVLWAAKRRFGRAGLIAAMLFLLVPILLAGSRAAWITYGVALLAFFWVEARSPLRFVAWVLAACVVVAAAMGVAWKTSSHFDARMDRTLAALHDSRRAINYASSGRIDIWRVTAKMITAHPVVGVGVRDFREAYPRFAPPNDHFVTEEACGPGEGACHPHQIVLEILGDTGAVGLILWLAGLALALRAWRRVGAAARARAFPVTVALAVTVFPLNTHLAFYSAWWGLLFWWLLALWCAALYADVPDDAPVQRAHLRMKDLAHGA